MRLNIQRLKECGYTVRLVSEAKKHHGDAEYVSEVTDIEIDGNGPPPGLDEFTEAMKSDFPRLDHDTVVGICYRALSEAQGLDIVKICTQGGG